MTKKDYELISVCYMQEIKKEELLKLINKYEKKGFMYESHEEFDDGRFRYNFIKFAK